MFNEPDEYQKIVMKAQFDRIIELKKDLWFWRMVGVFGLGYIVFDIYLKAH